MPGILISASIAYDSNYANAKEWAEYWCGPCEQLDMIREERDADDYYDYVEYYTMKDSEYGFTYTVNAHLHITD